MKKKNKTILVTGGAGFIGSAIVKRLVKKKFNIINIDKLTYASNLKNLNVNLLFSEKPSGVK